MPSPRQIVGRSRLVTGVLIVSALITLLMGYWRVRNERDAYRAQVVVALAERERAALDRQSLSDKLDDAVLALERAAEDNARLQREVVELALAGTIAEKREVLARFERERLAAERRRAAEDERRARERAPAPSPGPPAERSPSPSPAGSGGPPPSPTVTRSCLPDPLPPVCRTPNVRASSHGRGLARATLGPWRSRRG